MEPGEREIVHIDDLTAKGSGVGRGADGAAVFVRGALPGDTVLAECVKVKKRYREAELVSIEERSPDRVDSFCNTDCGGCPFRELRYEKQIEQKRRQIKDDLCRIGGQKDPDVKEMIYMEDPFRYRNKVTLQVQWKDGDEWAEGSSPAIGFFRRGTHEVIDCPLCKVQTAPVTAVASSLRTFMMQNHISAFDQKTKKGILKDVVVRTAFATGEVMVIMELGEDNIPDADKLIDMMDAQVRRIDDPDNGVWSLESVYTMGPSGTVLLLAGKPTITEMMGGVKYEVSPRSFYQVNPIQAERLYDIVTGYAEVSAGGNVLDLYCGVGSIGIYLSKSTGDSIRVLGIESNGDAVLDANRNAGINGIVNARFLRGKAEQLLPDIIESEEDTDVGSNKWFAREVTAGCDVAIVDPPRTGCDEALLRALVKVSPERIVYVSCDPATLSRDVRYLSDNGFVLKEATPVDMFPHTGHVETVCLLTHP